MTRSMWDFARVFGKRWAALMVGLVFCLAAVAPVHARSWRIIAFGDSLSAGFQLPASAAFPNVLEKSLRAHGFDVQVVNAAVSGDTVAGGLERVDWALAEGADIVILELGANDMLRGHDVERTMVGLDQLLTTIDARGARALLAGMRATPSLGADYVAQFDAIYPALAAKHGVPLYPFFLEGVAGDPALNKPDGLHPNKRGVEIIVEHIRPMVEAMLKP